MLELNKAISRGRVFSPTIALKGEGSKLVKLKNNTDMVDRFNSRITKPRIALVRGKKLRVNALDLYKGENILIYVKPKIMVGYSILHYTHPKLELGKDISLFLGKSNNTINEVISNNVSTLYRKVDLAYKDNLVLIKGYNLNKTVLNLEVGNTLKRESIDLQKGIAIKLRDINLTKGANIKNNLEGISLERGIDLTKILKNHILKSEEVQKSQIKACTPKTEINVLKDDISNHKIESKSNVIDTKKPKCKIEDLSYDKIKRSQKKVELKPQDMKKEEKVRDKVKLNKEIKNDKPLKKVEEGVVYTKTMSLYEFLKENPKSRKVDIALKYYDNKVIEQAIKTGKVLLKKGKLII